MGLYENNFKKDVALYFGEHFWFFFLYLSYTKLIGL